MFGRREKAWKTPGGQVYSLFEDMAQQPHLLVAGATGSGKSVVINGILGTLLKTAGPAQAGLILLDPKRVELVQYRRLPHHQQRHGFHWFSGPQSGGPGDGVQVD